MVNRVELVFLHQSHQVWKLESNDAVLVEQNLHPADKPIEIRYMGENIVPDDQIGLLSLGRQIACGVLAKETDQRRNCLVERPLGLHCRAGSIPKTGMPLATKYWSR